MRRILVVDDDPHICLAIRAWLKRYGFKVAIADGGASGLLALDNSTFDLMIVDIFMPSMRGFESIRVFHDHAPTVPLIAISGYAFSGQQQASPDFLTMALRLGALLPQALQADDIAERNRRMPVGGRASSKVRCHPGRRYQRGVGGVFTRTRGAFLHIEAVRLRPAARRGACGVHKKIRDRNGVDLAIITGFGFQTIMGRDPLASRF